MARFVAVALLVCAALAPTLGHAQDDAGATNLEKYLTADVLELAFPGAERYGAVEGDPPAAPVYRGDELVGYLFETYDLVRSVGFSRKEFNLIVGVGVDGVVRGARLIRHQEPIAILGRTDDDFHAYLTQFPGLDIRKGVSVVIAMSGGILEGEKFAQRTTAGNATDIVQVDAVSRTTTSSVLFSDAIVRGSRMVARSRGFLRPKAVGGRALELEAFEPATWPAMVADGSIASLSLTHGAIAAAFDDQGGKPPRDVKSWKEDETFVDLYMAMVTPAGIGVNILDRTWHDQYTAGRGVDDLLLLIASKGGYPVFDEEAEDGTFTRLQLVQGERTIALRRSMKKRLPFLHAKERPNLDEIGLFFLTQADGLNPVEPWRLELLIQGGEETPNFASFAMPYKLPDRFVKDVPVEEVAVNDADAGKGIDWRQVWRDHPVRIALLVATLVALTIILSAQDAISSRRRLHKWVRIGFLAWVLVWMGWYAGAQLTIINLLTVARTLVDGFRWDFFLIDPLIFVLMAFVTVGLFLWGRAIFCGWLCPFGAFQELLNKAAQALKIKQITLPEALQERLFAVKYLIFMGLLGATFYSFDLAIAGTAVEPFKTAITFRFDAPWLAVIYAVALLGAGLFVERFYCRFVCPLGAGLSILGRVRMFDWLKRRPQCGSQCHVCESVCPVGAIKRSGEIDMNECFYCLDCQVTYYDDHQCPPLIARRKRAETRARKRPAAEPTIVDEAMRQSAE